MRGQPVARKLTSGYNCKYVIGSDSVHARRRRQRAGAGKSALAAKSANPVAMLIALVLLAGCAGQMPAELRTPSPTPLTPIAARAAPERHSGSIVRWGGGILAVRNGPRTTDFEVLARPLDAAGRPKPDTAAAGADYGRFIARFEGFLDPAQYPRERLLTVTGTLVGVETRDVGSYPYRYPVVQAKAKHLWPAPAPEPEWPWYPDPWLGPPWPGWGPYAWYGNPWYRPWYW
jgi:outer membrane lipoprotein